MTLWGQSGARWWVLSFSLLGVGGSLAWSVCCLFFFRASGLSGSPVFLFFSSFPSSCSPVFFSVCFVFLSFSVFFLFFSRFLSVCLSTVLRFFSQFQLNLGVNAIKNDR